MLQQLRENELNEADGADDSAAPQPEDPFGEDDLHTGLGLDDMDGGANRPDDDGIGVPLDPPHEDLPPPPAHPSLYDAMDDVREALTTAPFIILFIGLSRRVGKSVGIEPITVSRPHANDAGVGVWLPELAMPICRTLWPGVRWGPWLPGC